MLARTTATLVFIATLTAAVPGRCAAGEPPADSWPDLDRPTATIVVTPTRRPSFPTSTQTTPIVATPAPRLSIEGWKTATPAPVPATLTDPAKPIPGPEPALRITASLEASQGGSSATRTFLVADLADAPTGTARLAVAREPRGAVPVFLLPGREIALAAVWTTALGSASLSLISQLAAGSTNQQHAFAGGVTVRLCF